MSPLHLVQLGSAAWAEVEDANGYRDADGRRERQADVVDQRGPANVSRSIDINTSRSARADLTPLDPDGRATVPGLDGLAGEVANVQVGERGPVGPIEPDRSIARGRGEPAGAERNGRDRDVEPAQGHVLRSA